MDRNEKVGIIGSGLIGRSWAMLFASVGYSVSLYDVESVQVKKALHDINIQLKELEKTGMLRGSLNASQQFSLINETFSLEECVKGAKYLQECIPEKLELKRTMFAKLDKIVDADTILASSTSCLLPSNFTESLKHRSNCIVTHPVNPPYYVPLVEIIPAPWTDSAVIKATKAIMQEIGQAPVVLNKEIDGFILNRLQYAIISEAWRLFEDGVASVEDIDTVMSEGLGMRYAFLGPLETAHLNAEGMEEYMQKYAGGIHKICSEFGPPPQMNTTKTLTEVNSQLCEKIPLDKLQEKRLWRDKRLTALAKLKKDCNKEE